ncbi:Hypothetical predicted protein [Marmota monax]|uniref:Uncharacterized protein n=1 Tax=Marmota monax TaxID=9995 RepID=A0A5E4C9N5_MARMO|nr:Hypothetical predicted protein [Marmota monax]
MMTNGARHSACCGWVHRKGPEPRDTLWSCTAIATTTTTIITVASTAITIATTTIITVASTAITIAITTIITAITNIAAIIITVTITTIIINNYLVSPPQV